MGDDQAIPSRAGRAYLTMWEGAHVPAPARSLAVGESARVGDAARSFTRASMRSRRAVPALCRASMSRVCWSMRSSCHRDMW